MILRLACSQYNAIGGFCSSEALLVKRIIASVSSYAQLYTLPLTFFHLSAGITLSSLCDQPLKSNSNMPSWNGGESMTGRRSGWFLAMSMLKISRIRLLWYVSVASVRRIVQVSALANCKDGAFLPFSQSTDSGQ